MGIARRIALGSAGCELVAALVCHILALPLVGVPFAILVFFPPPLLPPRGGPPALLAHFDIGPQPRDLPLQHLILTLKLYQ